MQHGVPGFALTVASRQQGPRTGIGGVADRDSGRSVTPDRLFRIGSITKTLNALAVLLLGEQGRLDLDTPYGRSFQMRRWRIPGRVSIPCGWHICSSTARAYSTPIPYWHMIFPIGGWSAERVAATLQPVVAAHPCAAQRSQPDGWRMPETKPFQLPAARPPNYRLAGPTPHTL